MSVNSITAEEYGVSVENSIIADTGVYVNTITAGTYGVQVATSITSNS